MNSEEFCRNRAAPPGSSLYYATLYHTPDERRRLHALFALCCEVEEAVHEARDPGLVRLKLEWWRNELAQLRSGTRQHPISAELQECADPGSAIDASRLDSFIDALMDHWQADAPETYEGWLNSLQRSYGEFWRQVAAACGVEDNGRLPILARTGALLGAFDELRHLSPALAAGRCIVPVQEMSNHGVTADQLAENTAPAAAPLLRDLLRRLRDDLRGQDRLLRRPPVKRLLCCRIQVRLAAALCAELERDPLALLNKRTALTPVRKLWIAWRTKL